MSGRDHPAKLFRVAHEDRTAGRGRGEGTARKTRLRAEDACGTLVAPGGDCHVPAVLEWWGLLGEHQEVSRNTSFVAGGHEQS